MKTKFSLVHEIIFTDSNCGDGYDSCPYNYTDQRSQTDVEWCGLFKKHLDEDRNKNLLRCKECLWEIRPVLFGNDQCP